MEELTNQRASRRALLRTAGLTGLAAAAAACSPTAAPVPQAPAAPAAPAAAPTPFKLNLDAAKSEGKVVGYGSMITSQENNLKELVQAAGVPFEFVRVPTRNQIITRVETEQNANVRIADFIDHEAGTVAYFAKEGFLQRLPNELLQKVPQDWRDPNGFYVGWFRTPIGFIYNTNLVPAAEAPKTMDDLLNPKWRGKIALTNPILNSSFATWFYFWQKQLGDARSDAFFKGLAAQNPTLFESGLTVSTNVNQGQFAIGLGFLTHVYSVGGVGGHLSYMKLDPQPAIQSVTGVFKNAPHPNAALLAVDTLTGTPFLTRAAAIGYVVPAPGLKSAIPGLEELNLKIMPDIPDQDVEKFGAYMKAVFAK